MGRHSPFMGLGALPVILFLFLISGCASTQPFPESILGTPELHVSNGYKLIKMGRYDDAEGEFEKALGHAPENSAAFKGIGLVKGYKGDFGPAFQSMEKAQFLARGKEEELAVYVGWIRLHTMKRGKGWLDEAKRAYSSACSLKEDDPATYYFMGLAYKHAYRFVEAKRVFEKVVAIHRAHVEDAEAELRIIEKIKEGKPVSVFGKQVAVQERITRAETAALLMHELALNQILEELRASQERNMTAASSHSPKDISAHPLRSEIESALRLDIAGLRVYADGTFGPDEYVTRAGFATMMADILSRVRNEPDLISRYQGRPSPFKDLRNEATYFGAVMACTAAGGLDAENGIFNPKGAVTGYDALLTIRKIRDRLNLSL
ncbi:MAG: S-layer homology domain-containing protein [Deltaproteobacteria bacterium]|nr:S-layer homology domain-containing protein [Deltaproteobacteria bacterium]